MKVLLLYFSGTGSTAELAFQLRDIIKTKGYEVEFYRITRDLMQNPPKNLEQYGLIGFGTPIWSWRTPRIITRFASKLKFPGVPYFLFFTCGGSEGNARWSLYKSLRKSDGKYMGSVVVDGTSNIRSWRPRLDQPPNNFNQLHPDRLKSAEDFISELLNNLANQEISEVAEMQSPSRIWYWSIINAIATYPFQMRVLAANKKVDMEKCTKCGLCAQKICPSGAITLNFEGIPQIKENLCFGCQGCLNLCPTLAIYNRSSISKQPFTTYKMNILKN